MEEKNTLIAVVLSMVILLFFYQFLYPRLYPQPLTPPAEVQSGLSNTETAEAPSAGEATTSEAPSVSPGVPVTPSTSQPEHVVTVENDVYILTMSSSGATIKSLVLKKFENATGEKMSILPPAQDIPPLSLGWDDEFQLRKAPFSITGGDLHLDESRPDGRLVFEYSGDGYSVKRTLTFTNGTYAIELLDEVSGMPSYKIALGTGFGISSDDSGGSYTHSGPVILYKGSDRKELKPEKIQAKEVFAEELKWAAREDKYFFAALVPKGKGAEASVWKRGDSTVVAITGTPGRNEFMVFAGPKDNDLLEKVGYKLEAIVDFGWFSLIARPLLWLLKKLYVVVGNYGWAIILLTLIIRIPFIPVTNITQRSMKKMSELNPMMQEIRAKYKSDPQKMNQEMMELYKKHKVNPLSGCLPLLLQIPVFFALYKVLLVSIELRSAPFMLWITDLSHKDPYYVLPIVMGISMFVQQKMTPTGGDQTQQKMLKWFMPGFFTFICLNLSSGLVLYWFVNNILAIAQQAYINVKKA